MNRRKDTLLPTSAAHKSLPHIRIPGSKSQTIRALLIAAFSPGTTAIRSPLDSGDTRSCLEACRSFGASISEEAGIWKVTGIMDHRMTQEENIPLLVDVGNSGTTLYLGLGLAAALGRPLIFTGDEQIRKRPVVNLTRALEDLGAFCSFSLDEIQDIYGDTYAIGSGDLKKIAELEPALTSGAAPCLIHGPLTGGETSIECPTSQYLSSLLLAAPLAEDTSSIHVPLLHERPYAEMTLRWLDDQGIKYSCSDDFSEFTVEGGQAYHSFDAAVSGDFSSASFFFCAAAITGSSMVFSGLDPHDPQGDKAVLQLLESMGCSVSWEYAGADGEEAPQDDAAGGGNSGGTGLVGGANDAASAAGEQLLTVSGPVKGELQPLDADLNAIPDALPILAMTACFARGTSYLRNVPQARIKETDRIAVMRRELEKLGAEMEELEDGLIIHGKGFLDGGQVEGHGDHRVIMSLAVAGLAARGEIEIQGTDAAAITFPTFFTLLDEIRRKEYI